MAPLFLMEVDFIWQFGLVTSHTLPIILLLINYYMTDSVIRVRDCWHSFLLAVVYCSLNYLFCEQQHSPVYPFLTWENPFTAVYCFLCFLFGQGLCAFTGYIQERVQGRSGKLTRK